MKAFQLKIAIKNSKPPIWRRVVIPTGITFSQLSMILNEVMGWSGYHMFRFEFYHRELCIMEDAEEYAGIGSLDYLEASTTFIREFLEENDWFTYTYDLGDDWQHRVTIEQIIDDWEYSYPKVIKYKGDCPVEDCGGINGYYDCLSIIGDKGHPEYEERLEWMNMQGYPNKYDLEYTNQQLEEDYFYIQGKRETRWQREIYEDHFNGIYGLKATKNDKNKNLHILQSGRHKMDASLQKMADLMREYIALQQKTVPQLPVVSTLKDIFEDYEKNDLIEIAREKGVLGSLGNSKKQVIEKLYTFMMDDTEIKKYFYCMDAAARRDFREALNCKGFYEPENVGNLENLYKGAYIGMLEDGRMMVPEDVKQAYQKLLSKAFEKECDKRSYILYCLEASKLLYGIVPMEVFQQLVNTGKEELSVAEVQMILKEIPVEYMEFVVKHNKLYHKELYPDDRGLLRAQKNKSYYIPTREEIEDIGQNGYLSKDKYIKEFQKYMINTLGAMADEAKIAGAVIWGLICGDCEMQSILDVLDDLGLMVDSERELHVLIQKINNLWNHTRKLLNRGYTPYEMSRPDKILHVEIPKNNIVNFEEARKNKIYPNDPCPCGSGRKYKNCCKNKK